MTCVITSQNLKLKLNFSVKKQKKTNLVKGQIGPIEMVEGSKSDQMLV
jgi:hypothetical protein